MDKKTSVEKIICGNLWTKKVGGREMLNIWGRAKKVEEMFGGMKNNLYLCIVKSNQYVARNLRALSREKTRRTVKLFINLIL